MNGHKEIVKVLLEKGADPHFQDEDGRMPASRAAMNGHVSIIKLLLAKRPGLDPEDWFGRTALAHAAGNGQEAAVRLLLPELETVIDPDYLSSGCYLRLESLQSSDTA